MCQSARRDYREVVKFPLSRRAATCSRHKMEFPAVSAAMINETFVPVFCIKSEQNLNVSLTVEEELKILKFLK